MSNIFENNSLFSSNKKINQVAEIVKDEIFENIPIVDEEKINKKIPSDVLNLIFQYAIYEDNQDFLCDGCHELLNSCGEGGWCEMCGKRGHCKDDDEECDLNIELISVLYDDISDKICVCESCLKKKFGRKRKNGYRKVKKKYMGEYLKN